MGRTEPKRNRTNSPPDDWRCDCGTLNDGKVRDKCRENTCKKPRDECQNPNR